MALGKFNFFRFLSSSKALPIDFSAEDVIVNEVSFLHSVNTPFIFNTDKFWKYANKFSDGSMSKRLSPKTLLEYEFDLPDDNELEALADLLWSLVDTKNAYEELLIKTDDLVKSQFLQGYR